MASKKLIIHGEKKESLEISAEDSGLQLKEEYIISAGARDQTETYTATLGEDNIAEFIFEDDSTWICNSESLHELFPDANISTRSGDAFEVPATLKNPNNDRGFLSDLALKALRIFVRIGATIAVRKLAEKLENENLEGKEGLFRLDENFILQPLDDFTKISSGKPLLLFLHGTNSSVQGAFAELSTTEVWNFIKAGYDNNILAFQHRTLTESPLENAVRLSKELPPNAELHIISHSRGGIIGDILCRYARNNGDKNNPFTKTNLDFLKKETGRENDISNIKSLNSIYSNKKITVTKFIRVACPAAGTKLASNRLSYIFNVFFNLVKLIPNPATRIISDILKMLIAEVIRTKDNVNVLPGVEAQSPDSPFIKILNDRTPEASVSDTPLAIIAGSSQPESKFRGLKVIALKLFFEQRNDLVVNTDSMYLGCSRKDNINYFFAEGIEVNHVDYFVNNKTIQAILLALKTPLGEPIPGYNLVPQLEVPATDRAFLGIEHGELLPKKPSGKKPIVVLLPGIMGSTLHMKDRRIWINYLEFLGGSLTDLEDISNPGIKATSLIKTSYKKLADHLSFTYDVVIYPFDWRKQLNDCALEFNQTIIDLMELNQPIKIIGHSMGGVLVRDFIVKHNDTWQKLNKRTGFRLVFLGSPLGGSFRIPAVLFGCDGIINSLSRIDQRHTKRELLEMFSKFPGILSLLPLATKDGHDFADENTWQKMSEAFGDTTWPLPDKKVLDEFKAYRDEVLSVQEKIDYSNMVYIAGKDKATPCDYFNDLGHRNELVFLYTGEGDQSVTWESGIPKEMKKENVYYVDATHGALANDSTLFDGIEDILDKGLTSRFTNTKPEVRGEEKKFRMVERPYFDLSENGLENIILGLHEKPTFRIGQIPVSVTVSCGDLRYSSYPVIAGHFKNDGILYAEKAIDNNLNARLSSKHSLGIYPGDIGTSDVILNTAKADFRGVIIVGLGEPGTLSMDQLSKTVEQGVANYLLSIEQIPQAGDIGISALIIGCGYGGLSIESSAKAIIEGVNNANLKIAQLPNNKIMPLQHIEFIELYEDRALNCLFSLRKIESSENRLFNIKIGSRKMKKLFGGKKRLPLDEAATWWNRISVRVKSTEASNEKDTNEKGCKIKSMIFGSSTGDAREDEKELFSSTELIDVFIEEISTNNNWNETTAKAIFELMVPNEFKDRLKRKGNASWVLDETTASYPWELLQDSVINTKPLCVNAGMIRQLSITDFPTRIKRSATEKALIVGDPKLDGYINQLNGAKQEAIEVNKLFEEMGFGRIDLIGKKADEIVRHLFSDDYKIIHLAGHGLFNPKCPTKSGMVIGKEKFLTAFDIAQISGVPELVFINCCHLGKVSGVDEKFYKDRYKLAANIGTQLIRMGVKAVIAAGWKVHDEAACDFAKTFYNRMFKGATFGEAVKDARAIIYEKYRSYNTWGAYQCYGDPFYQLINRKSDKESKPVYLTVQEAEIDLINLYSKMDTRSVTEKSALTTLAMINDAIKTAGVGCSELLEKQAMNYAEMGHYEKAIDAFNELFKGESGHFVVSALEKYCNISAKAALEKYDSAKKNGRDCEEEIGKAIQDLQYLLKIGKTAERYNLLGSAYKRMAIVCDEPKRRENLIIAAYYYYQGSEQSGFADDYPIANWYEMEYILRLDNESSTWKENEQVKIPISIPRENEKLEYTLLNRNDAIAKLQDLRKKSEQASDIMDYWKLLSGINTSLCEMILSNTTDQQKWDDLLKTYCQLWSKSGSPGKRKAERENLKILLQLLPSSTALYIQIKNLEEQLSKLVVEK